jgi:hypothetical protein
MEVKEKHSRETVAVCIVCTNGSRDEALTGGTALSRAKHSLHCSDSYWFTQGSGSSSSLASTSSHNTSSMLALILYPEDGGSRFLQTTSNTAPDYISSHPRE